MKLTLGQVARELGMNKATLSRYVKQGKISAKKQEDGSYRN
jgi:predicted site-specific integrase-resolvase